MRHLTCHLQEVPQDLPSLSDKLQDPRVKWYKRGPRLDPKPPATSAHPHRLLCIRAHVKPGPARAN